MYSLPPLVDQGKTVIPVLGHIVQTLRAQNVSQSGPLGCRYKPMFSNQLLLSLPPVSLLCLISQLLQNSRDKGLLLLTS